MADLSFTHDVCDVVRQLLIDLGLGSDGGTTWPVFIHDEADIPDDSIFITNTQGRVGPRINQDGRFMENYGIQVKVRHSFPLQGGKRARLIKDTLVSKESVYDKQVTINSSVYEIHSINHETGPLPLGKEIPASRRHLFTWNSTVTLRQLT